MLEIDEDCWLQQDNATCHTSNETMNFLRKFFWRAYHIQRIMAPRSLDLTPPDFFLWVYLKGRIYKNRPQTLDELKSNITTEINLINVSALHKVATNVVKQVNNEQGNHFEYMLYKTLSSVYK